MPGAIILRLLDKYQLRHLFYFGLISGAGLALDFAVFFLGLFCRLDPFWANLAGNITGVTFVFVVSTHRLFATAGRFLWHKFILYLLYNLAASVLLSGAVKAMAAAGLWPPLAKTLMLPVSFYCSYLFMRWLMTGKFSWR